MTITHANRTGDFLHRRRNPGWTAFRGGLLGYAVATAAGAALTANLSIVTGSFDELRSLQLFMALGTVGVHLGCLMANRPRDDTPAEESRPEGLAWWANLVLLVIVLGGSVGLTVLGGWWYDRVRSPQTQRAPGRWHERKGNLLCDLAGRPGWDRLVSDLAF